MRIWIPLSRLHIYVCIVGMGPKSQDVLGCEGWKRSTQPVHNTFTNSFNLVSFVRCIPECLRVDCFFFFLENRTGLHSPDHRQPSPVISPLSSIEISLLLTLAAFSLFLPLVHTQGETHTHLSLHAIYTQWISLSWNLFTPHLLLTPCVCMHTHTTHTHAHAETCEMCTGTNHQLPAVNEDITTPGCHVPPAVPLNPAIGSNVDGLPVIEKDVH